MRLDGLTRRYPGGTIGLLGLDLAVPAGERLAVLGPSGAGKSTLLRLIAGLERPDAGSVSLDGRVVDALPPHERHLGMVFQEPAVYPHLSVFENLAFGLRAARAGRAEIRARVDEVAGRLRLADELGRRPGELSGGQRQRVALGRALARRPGLLLLDEPFTALDAPLRLALRADLLALQRSEGFTMLHVTHDQAEAMALGDRLAVLVDGRLAGHGTPAELYDRPPNRTVAGFLGQPPMMLVGAVASWDGITRTEAGPRLFAHAIGGHDRGGAAVGMMSGQVPAPLAVEKRRVVMGVRPEHLRLTPSEAYSRGEPRPVFASEVAFEGVLGRLEFAGHERIARFQQPQSSPFWTLRLSPGEDGWLPHDRMVMLRIDLSRASWFDAGSGDRWPGT